MEQKISRRIIASIMCASLVLTFVPAFALSQVQSAFAAITTKAGPAICNVCTEVYDEDEDEYEEGYEGCITPDGINRSDVRKIVFVNTNTVPDDAVASCDASEAKDESVMCWVISTSDGDEDEDYDEDEDCDGGSYDLYYGADGLYPSLPVNSSNLFGSMEYLSSIENLDKVNTSNVTNMSGMFNEDDDLQSLDLSNFNTSKVTDMSEMFYYCYDLKTLNLSSFDTSNVEYMYAMFRSCRYLKKLDLSKFNTSKVTSMHNMFRYCDDLKELNLSSFNTSNVETMGEMFYYCSSLKSLDLSSFKTSKVEDMSSMFEGCDRIRSLNLSNFDTQNVEYMYAMFRDCSSLTSLNLSSFKTSKVEDMSHMFDSCYILKSLDLSNFDCSSLAYADHMLSSAKSLESVYVSSSFKLPMSCETYCIFDQAYSIKGEKGTTYDENMIDNGDYARVDGGKSSPGYFRLANNASVSVDTADCTYNGNAKTPNIVVKCGQTTLTQCKDYTVSYSGDRKSVGTHKLTLKGCGAYSFSITKNYVVNPKAVSLKSLAAGNKALTVKWAKSSKANASGYQIQIAKNKKFSKGKKTINVKGYNVSSKKITKLNSGKKYFVKVRAYKAVGGKTYYSTWSKVLSKKTK